MTLYVDENERKITDFILFVHFVQPKFGAHATITKIQDTETPCFTGNDEVGIAC